MQHLVGREAGARILDAQADPVVAVLPGRHPDPPRLARAVGDGVEGEAEQAAQHLTSTWAVDPQRQVGHGGDAQADAAALRPQPVGGRGAVDQLAQAHALELRRTAAEEALQAMHHLAGAPIHTTQRIAECSRSPTSPRSSSCSQAPA